MLAFCHLPFTTVIIVKSITFYLQLRLVFVLGFVHQQISGPKIFVPLTFLLDCQYRKGVCINSYKSIFYAFSKLKLFNHIYFTAMKRWWWPPGATPLETDQTLTPSSTTWRATSREGEVGRRNMSMMLMNKQ